MRSCGSPTEQGYISHNQGIYGVPVRTFFLNVDHRQTTNRVGSNIKCNLPYNTYLIYEWLKQRGGTALLAWHNTINGNGSHFIRHISKLHPSSSLHHLHFHYFSVNITQKGSRSQHQGPIEIWPWTHDIHSTPNRGNSGVCIKISPMEVLESILFYH